MQNILIALDATDIDMQTLDFACYLGRLTRSKITGIFLENLVADNKPAFKRMHGATFVDWQVDETDPLFRQKKELIEANIALFTTACEKRGVRSSIHRNEGVPASEIIAESRFADLVVVDAATSFKKIFEGSPTHFVKDILKDAECPVIIAPESFEGIDEIVFTYDGSASSVFAMKQFTYLFTELDDKKVTVFHVNENAEWSAEEKHRLSGWLQSHYSIIGFQTAEGDASYEMLAYLLRKKNVFIVMGAYGRNAFSRYFKHSRADILVKTITQPMFIAHH
jgi:nucleotide-binding universal stress UspA family protein